MTEEELKLLDDIAEELEDQNYHTEAAVVLKAKEEIRRLQAEAILADKLAEKVQVLETQLDTERHSRHIAEQVASECYGECETLERLLTLALGG